VVIHCATAPQPEMPQEGEEPAQKKQKRAGGDGEEQQAERQEKQDEKQEQRQEEQDQPQEQDRPALFREAAAMYRRRSEYPQAIEFLCRAVRQEPRDAASWAWLGYCYLMLDDVDRAYVAYQQAMYVEPPMDEPHVWYGLGLLYERNRCDAQAAEYLARSLELGEGADFARRADCTFRLGLVHKRRKDYGAALRCFMRLSAQGGDPGAGHNMEQLQAKLARDQASLAALRASDGYTAAQAATEGEIGAVAARMAAVRSLSELWFQIGHTHELRGKYQEAKEAYSTVLTYDPRHAKVLQKLGWLYYHVAPGAARAPPLSESTGLEDPAATAQQDQAAMAYLERAVASDGTDHQAWYLLGKCCTRQKQYQKGFRAYEQAVLLNGKEPVYWCSLGILYYYNSQYHEALDTYARALQLKPDLCETWHNLGVLYENCHQLNDAADAYRTAVSLAPGNKTLRARLEAAQQRKRGQQLAQIPTAPSYNFAS